MGTVRATDLVKTFGTVIAVDGLSFEARAGEFLTLLGPSGCGKTTTLRLIAGLERPDRGEILVGDRAISSTTSGLFVPPERRGMGMVFQSYAIWPHMTVFENVAFPLRELRVPRAETRERVMAMLATVGLGELHARPAPMLSGGQQQRVALARALVSNPQVLLLDEPLSNLDARLREEMRFELREMQAKLGITSIFVTHDQAEAMTLSDRIVVMNAGRIEQEGSPEDVYQRPSTRFVMDFLGRANHLPARIAKGEDGSLVAEVEESGGCSMPVAGGGGSWSVGQEVLLAFRPEAVEAQAAERDGVWVGLVRSSVYVSGHVEYVVEIGKFPVRAIGPEDARLPHDARAKLCVSPRAVRIWPRDGGANGRRAR
ncbi:MAG TPA: ABC transporter ATP-binding protein [Methylomirabilota bacterium]|jgi:iron(III) transport system ATP-binding protein